MAAMVAPGLHDDRGMLGGHGIVARDKDPVAVLAVQAREPTQNFRVLHVVRKLKLGGRDRVTTPVP